MTAIAHVRSRRTRSMVIATLVVVACLGGLLYTGAKALARYQGARNTVKPSVVVPATPIALLATVDERDDLTSATLFVLRPDGAPGGSVVSVPVSADATGGAGEQPMPLTQAYDEGGVDALVPAVEDALGIAIDVWAVADPATLEALLTPLEPFEVTLQRSVETLLDGENVPLYAPGEFEMSAFQLAKVVNARALDQREAGRRPAIQAVWQSVVAKIGQGLATVDTGGTPTTFEQVFARLLAGPVLERELTVEPSTGIPNVDSDVLDRADTAFVFACIAPGSTTAPAPGMVFRIEAPPGYDAKVLHVVRTLLFLGGNVQSIWMGGPARPETALLLYDDALTSSAEYYQQYFGRTVVEAVDTRVQGVDVIIQLGADYLDSQDPNMTTLPATTTTTTMPE